MVKQALQCLEEADTLTAIEFLNRQPEPLSVVTAAYHDLIKELYWQKSDILLVISVCQAGIQFCFNQAEKSAAEDSVKTYALRSAARQMAYNLASYTWPGWNEDRMVLQPHHIADGMDAARLNLRLALELDKGDLTLSRAYWMLAGHLLAANATAGAQANYRRAAMYASRAGEEAEQLFSLAFAALACWIDEPQSSGCRLAYEKAREVLAAMENSLAYLEQLDSAREVFFSEQ